MERQFAVGKPLTFLFVCLFWLLFPGAAGAQNIIFWSEDGAIFRSELDGESPEQIAGNGIVRPRDLVLDTTRGHLYWTDVGTIWRARTGDWQYRQITETGDYETQSLALHPRLNRLYWGTGTAIRQLDLETGQVEDLMTWGHWALPVVAVDPVNDRLYWGQRVGSEAMILRSELDGSGSEVLDSQSGGFPYCLTLDLQRGKVYWGVIEGFFRADLDGANRQWFVGGTNPGRAVTNIEVGHSGEGEDTVYWTAENDERVYRTVLSDTVHSGSFHHITGEAIVEDQSAAHGLVVDGEYGTFYWTNPHNAQIKRASLSDPRVELLLKGDLLRPTNLQLDELEGKLYWLETGYAPTSIQRSDLDGNNRDTLVVFDEEQYVCGLAVDPARRHMYWTKGNYIQRSNLDGSDAVDLLGPSTPRAGCGLAIDPSGARLFWADSAAFFATDVVSRSTEALFGLPNPVWFASVYEVGFSETTTALYWIDDSWPRGLYRTNVEDLSTVEIQKPVEGQITHFALTRDSSIIWAVNPRDTNVDGWSAIWLTDLDGQDAQRLVSVTGNWINSVAAMGGRSTSAEHDPGSAHEVSVYPNPARTHISIEFGVSLRDYVFVGLYDVVGRRISHVFSGEVTPSSRRHIDVDVRGLSAGVYVLRLSGEHVTADRKVLVNL